MAIITFMACKKSSDSPIPKISFISVEPDYVRAGSGSDTVYFWFNYQDGDGDIGYPESDTTYNVFFEDQRDNSLFTFQFPEIPKDYLSGGGARGEFFIAYNAAFLFKRTDSLHLDFDTVKWNVYVIDQAGNKSNIVETTPVILTN